MLNREHDPAPNGGSVNHLLSFFHCFQNIVGGFFWLDRERSCTLRRFEHFSFQETRLYSEHVYAMPRQPVTQRFQISCQSCLGRAVTRLANTTTVASNGCDTNNLPCLCRLKHLGN